MKPILHVDMDDTIVSYTSALNNALEKNPGIQYPQSQMDFFRKLKPIKGAIETIVRLNKIGFDIYILSCPSPLNPLSYTEKRIWVEEHLGEGFIEKLILTMNKGLVKGDYLVDDWIEGRGQENFEGELIQFGSERFPDWEAINTYLESVVKITKG